jgi:hypothetical protein
MTPRFQLVYVVVMAATMAYAIYGFATETGVAGYLIRKEAAFNGTVALKLTIVLTWLVFFLPFAAIFKIVEIVAPSLVLKDPNAQYKPGIMERLHSLRHPYHVSWKAILVVCAIPIVVGVGIVPAYYYLAHWSEDKVYPLDLNSRGAAPANNAKHVEVTGTIRQPYVLTYEQTRGGYVHFSPITGDAWTPADPVRYFVRMETQQRRAAWPEAFRRGDLAKFRGRIGRPLPDFVESRYRSMGLQFGSGYSVIEWNDAPVHNDWWSGDYATSAGIGMGLSAYLFLIMIAVKFSLEFRNRRQPRKTQPGAASAEHTG